jgi:glycosyltransferase involved in cell wall biosynthesis
MGDGPLRLHLQALADQLLIHSRVWLLGEVHDPRALFKHARVCVVSSKLEGFPNVLLEMMTVNGSVVSTLCADGIQDLPGVITCKPEDALAMISALNEALSLSETERNQRFKWMQSYLKRRNYSSYWDSIVNLAGLESGYAEPLTTKAQLS